ncbi:MAG: amidohydrolase family protein, partial [Myxococcota bacterium]|nr:amidohydrolase family protein [Myxococcota bacterium]
MFSLLTLLPIMIALGAGGAAAAPAQVAELVLRGGKIVTVDDDIQQAEAIAVAGDTILAVGGDDHIGAFIGPETRVIDLEGQLAIPGFIESHAHFASMGEAGSRLNLTETSSWEEIVAMVARAVGEADPGEWIAGRGWHQDKWVETPAGSVEGVPLHHSLSAVSPHNPVALRHASGLLDVSPLFKYEVSGPDAAALLSWVWTRDVARLEPGMVAYGCWCDERGKVVDDGTVACLEADRYRMTAAEPNLRWLMQQARGFDVAVSDESERIAALALQGPTSRRVLRELCGEEPANLDFFRGTRARVGNLDFDVTRTGYTG